MKDASWVVVGGKIGETAHCRRCGEGLVIGLPARMKVFLAANKAFIKAHESCPDIGYREPTPRTPEEWIAGRDTGASSATIWSALTGSPSPDGRYDVPHDGADFGRCYRLLDLFPEWRPRLVEVAVKHPAWTPFAREWAALTALYETDSDDLYAAIKRLESEAA